MKSFEKVENLEPEKRKRILHAALREFAEKGYDQASTNQIVKEAEISKGMLFYYFNNKEDLYHYLINYGLKIVREEFLDTLDETIPDFLDRLKYISQAKLAYFWNYPAVNQFMGTILLEKDLELPVDLQGKLQETIAYAQQKTYSSHSSDKNPFRKDVDSQKAAQLIEWTIRGYQQETLERLKGKKMTELDLEKMWDEFDEYIEILRTAFYQ